jgi:lactate dehydrogenase-like 2-hydroxyacid dehydrogenase
MGFKVVQTADLPGVSDYCKQAFQKTGVEYQISYCTTGDEIIAAANDADGVIVIPGRLQPISREVIESLPECRYILSLISGYDAIDIEAATEHGILVTSMQIYSTRKYQTILWHLSLPAPERLLSLTN